MNRPVTATGVVPAASATRLSELWPTPAEARDWVVDVVGENIVTTCDTCRKDSVPCTGLLPKLNQESSSVTTDLQDLVSGTTQPTLANLEQVTAPGIALTRQVIEAIRRMPPSEQGLIIDRQVPEVCATEVARTHAERAIEELDRILTACCSRPGSAKRWSPTRWRRSSGAPPRRNASMNVPQASPIDPRPLSHGRVQ